MYIFGYYRMNCVNAGTALDGLVIHATIRYSFNDGKNETIFGLNCFIEYGMEILFRIVLENLHGIDCVVCEASYNDANTKSRANLC